MEKKRMKKKYTNMLMVTLLTCRCASAGTVIQFGGSAGAITNVTRQAQIKVDQVIQWNGINSWGKGSYGANGSLVDKGIDASVYSSNRTVTLTTQIISSKEAGASVTADAGSSLGVDTPKDWGKMEEKFEDHWVFDFDKDVQLHKLLFVGMDKPSDSVKISIKGAQTYKLTKEDMKQTYSWSGKWDLLLYEFSDAPRLKAGTRVTIEAAGGANPANNSFGIQAIIITAP
jgi:hypothetical protein